MKISDEKLDELIEEATIDCYDEYECLTGFYNCLEQEVQFPFKATAVGEEIEVTGVEMKDPGIDAICKRKGKRYTVDLLNISYQKESVHGSEWIEAYRKWSS